MYSYTKSLDNLSKPNIINDYELLKSIYGDSLELYEEDLDYYKLSFQLNMIYEIDITEKLAEIIKELKLSKLLLSNTKAGIPYYIRFDLNKSILTTSISTFWLRKNLDLFKNLNESSHKISEESIFYTSIEIIKQFLNEFPPDKTILMNWLLEIKENNVIHSDTYMFNSGKFNYGGECDSELEGPETSGDGLSLLKSRSDQLIINSQNKKSKEKECLQEDQELEKCNNQSLYEQFYKDGGVLGDIIKDRGSTFQAYAIKINSTNQIQKYLECLKSHNKILKATHNILAYRIIENPNKDNNVTEGYDDDGEDGAGIKLLGTLEKIKVVNIMVVVSRWFGGVYLFNDRFKHINDSANKLIANNKACFDFLN